MNINHFSICKSSIAFRYFSQKQERMIQQDMNYELDHLLDKSIDTLDTRDHHPHSDLSSATVQYSRHGICEGIPHCRTMRCYLCL